MKGLGGNLGAFVVSLVLLALAGLLWFRPGTGAADLEAMQIGWAAERAVWIKQNDHWRGELALKAVAINREADVGREVLLQAICAKVLDSPLAPRRDFAPAQVYRLDLALYSMSGDRLLAEHAVPVPVWDGLCHAPAPEVALTYPGPLTGWQLHLLNPELDAQGLATGAYSLIFRPFDERADLEAFDPVFACQAVLVDSVVAANAARMAPNAKPHRDGDLDPEVTAFFGQVWTSLMSLVPGGAWGLRRETVEAAGPLTTTGFDATAMLVLAEDNDTRRAWELTVDGAVCALVEEEDT